MYKRQLNLCSIDTPTDVYSVFFLQFRTFAQNHVTWPTSQFTIFWRAKATRCTRSELTQARQGRCHKRQHRRKVIKHRMYNYRKHGTNEPTVTDTLQIITKRSISAGEMYSTICVESWAADHFVVCLTYIDPLLTKIGAENDLHFLSHWPWHLTFRTQICSPGCSCPALYFCKVRSF